MKRQSERQKASTRRPLPPNPGPDQDWRPVSQRKRVNLSRCIVSSSSPRDEPLAVRRSRQEHQYGLLKRLLHSFPTQPNTVNKPVAPAEEDFATEWRYLDRYLRFNCRSENANLFRDATGTLTFTGGIGRFAGTSGNAGVTAVFSRIGGTAAPMQGIAFYSVDGALSAQ